MIESNGLTATESFDKHRLSSQGHGESQIEILATRIETRRENRIALPFRLRVAIIDTFYKISVEEKYRDRNRVHLEDVVKLVKKEEESDKYMLSVLQTLGFFNEKALKLEVYERAKRAAEETKDDGWLYYRDFMFYHTVETSYWPFLRNATRVAILYMFCFYMATAIFFCAIVEDEQICPVDPTDKDRPFYGWLSALYFASTTISTVGYGDLNVEKDPRSRIFYGIVYMLFAMFAAISLLGAVAETAFSKFKGPVTKLFDRFYEKFAHLVFGDPKPDDHLYLVIRRLRFQITSEITVQFFLLNLFGTFVSRFFANNRADDEGEDWNWMTSFYWAVQTSTTIGYGDLAMPFEMRWFQIFYLTLSTYFAGNALGRLGSLGEEITLAKRHHAWERREVSKGLLHDFRTDDEDDSIDQYEFAIASLLILGTITSDDLVPIMDRFRKLAGTNGYIAMEAVAGVDESEHKLAKLVTETAKRETVEEVQGGAEKGQ